MSWRSTRPPASKSALNISSRPQRAASIRPVRPLTSCSFGSAPAAKRALTIGGLWIQTDNSNILTLGHRGWAPCSNKANTIGRLPRKTARAKTFSPSLLGSAPALSKFRTSSAFPSLAAKFSGHSINGFGLNCVPVNKVT